MRENGVVILKVVQNLSNYRLPWRLVEHFFSAENAASQRVPLSGPRALARTVIQEETGLAIKGMENIVRGFLDNALAPETVS